ncbi:GAP family protein [Mycolicibacterium sp. 050158]|uniref:GAP family protein n=1 Tax=Mycolicibacterium sp. 050158 TaxID=3090602 RepID=UPI00299EEA34|nr:GAP family protein [Mycolicibacterium sp. 050158]MDX1892219.1 GAP family protein [Mycolicibacterium sp. 050158]
MLGLLLPLLGFALLDSLNVLNLGVTSAVVYDSRLSRRSALPGGLSFVAGVFVATASFGLLTVVGITFVTGRVEFDVTPTIRYWGQLVLGLVLIAVASLSGAARPTPPLWALNMARRNPWLFAIVGLVIGAGQAVTSVPYLTTLTMLSARHPLPTLWPVLILCYCAVALLPSVAVLALSTQRTIRARRVQRNIVRVTTRYGPVTVRVLFLGVGIVLVAGALWNYRVLF